MDQIKRVTVCVTYASGEERRHVIPGNDLPGVLLRRVRRPGAPRRCPVPVPK